jgi:hypothetical protein
MCRTDQDFTVDLRRFLICSANQASQLGWLRISSQSSILFCSSKSPESRAWASFSISDGGRAACRPWTSPSASSRKRNKTLKSAGMYSLRFGQGDL